MHYLVKPWKHQEIAINMALAENNFAFFMEQGTGKTCAAINTLRGLYVKYGRVLKTLVLCPPVVIENWRREFEMHSKVASKVTCLVGSEKKRIKAVEGALLWDKNAIFITNYEAMQMKDLYKLFSFWMPEVIVCDESHRLKNPKAIRTKKIIALGDMAKHRYILTGTPILNSGMDIWAQYRFLDLGQSFDKNFYVFRGRYFMDKNAGMPVQRYFPCWMPRESSYKEFNDLIYKKAYRILKHECLDLPPLLKTQVTVEMTPTQNRMYQSMLKHFVAYLNDKACTAQIALTRGLRLQQIISGFFTDEEEKTTWYDDNPRLKALSELLEDYIEPAKIIIWACFRENYEMIAKMLASMEINHVMLIGGLTGNQRQESIDRFNTDDDCRVMVANQGAGGVGVNLTAASVMIYYSRNFSLEQDLQSEARAHRGGSEIHEKITRIDLVCPNTIDDLILQALYQKQNISDEILKWKFRL